MSECSPEDYSRSRTDPSNIFCLSRGDSIGITVSTEAGLVSLIAILYILFIIARNVRWRIRHLTHASLRIFHQPIDILMASLIFGDALQAIGIVQSLKWIQDGKVEIGGFCNSQGIIKSFGASGVAFSTMAIALYTFIGVFIVNISSMRFTFALVVAIWTFIAAIVTAAMVGNRNQDFSFMAPTPYWCWISKYHVGPGWKLVAEYLWMWLTLALSFLLYIPLYLWMRGNLILSDGTWWRVRFSYLTDTNPETRSMRRRSLLMLLYPLVYCICTLPLSAVRWTNYVHKDVFIPPAVTFAVVPLFGLSGFFNVILLLKTRQSAGLFGHLMLRQPVRPPLPLVQPEEVMELDMDVGRPPPMFMPRP